MFIGTIIRDLRIKNNMTQQELADKIFVTVPYISKIENGKRNVTNDLLKDLSGIFNIDLLGMVDSFKQFNSYEEFERYYFLRELIELKDIDNIEKCINENFDIFSINESVLLGQYCKALVDSIKYKRFQNSNEICYRALGLNKETILEEIKKSSYTNSAYSIFTLLSYNYRMLNEDLFVSELCRELVFHYESIINDGKLTYLKQDFFFKKTYIIFLNNYAYILYIINNFY